MPRRSLCDTRRHAVGRDEHTELYRGILVLAVVAIPAFALVEWEGTYDPFAPRSLFAGAALAAYLGSYKFEWVRRNLRWTTLVLCGAVCKELVTRVDGTLAVASAASRGSVFTARLPAA